MPIDDVNMGRSSRVWNPNLVNLYGCTIGNDCSIGTFVEIGPDVVIGDRCRIQAFSFIPKGVTLEDDVFIGPNVTFTNDKHPPSHGKWDAIQTLVKKGATIGAGALILPGVTIGEKALIGAGAVVTKDVPPFGTVYGVPARVKG